jgi:hypothetical protein
MLRYKIPSAARTGVPSGLPRAFVAARLALALLVASINVGCDDRRPAPAESTAESSRIDAWLGQAMASKQFSIACSNTPGCSATDNNVPLSSEPLWRVRVSRTGAGEFSIEDIDHVEVVVGSGVPIGAVHSMLALVGLDSDGAVLDGQPIRFAESLRVEGETDVAIQDLAGHRVDTIGFVRQLPGIVRLAIQDRSGNVLAQASTPVSNVVSTLRLESFLGIRDAVAATRPFGDLPAHCSHIIVLQGERDRHLAGGIEFEDTLTLTTPGPYQLAGAAAALRRMTPMLCQSIARIAFGYIPDHDGILGAVRSAGAGDMILINVTSTLSESALEEMENRRLMLQSTIIHEAGHAAETLLTFEGSNPGNYTGAWSFPARTLAADTIDKVRLEMGLPEEWQRLHNSFVNQGWAKAWGSLTDNGSPENVVHGGFISRGASKNWAEDIASTVGQTYMSRAVTDAYQEHGVSDTLRQDLGCLVMRRHPNTGLPSHFAALYTKMRFLQDLGLLKEDDVVDCTGENLGLRVESAGFHVREWLGSTRVRSYQNQLEAGLGSLSGGVKVFEMKGAGTAGFGGKTYPARIELRLDLGGRFARFDRVSWPRGVYELGLMGNTNFRLRLDGAAAGNFDAMDGYVLVAESSSERITGSAVLQRVFRLHAPLPVPELHDPPLVVRFMMQR